MGLLSVLVYLAPIALLVIVRSRRDRSLWEVALDIPTAFAGDLLGVLLLARVFPLETAAFVARGLELAAAGVWLFLRRRNDDRWGWPRELRLRALSGMLATAGMACALSMSLSRKYHIWDRYWHVNLVTSIRGQRLPFANVYDPSGPLSYHYAGDALGAMLQSFSLGAFHSSLSLSLAHDIVFSLSGATLGLLFLGFGARGISTTMLGTLSWFLAGPTALVRDDGKQFAGYDFVNYMTLSFRPHVSVAGLLLIGVVTPLLARAREAGKLDASRAPANVSVAPILLCTALLSVTDEASCGLLGLALGCAWLVWPKIVGVEWKRGLVVMVGLLVVVVAANLLYAGLFSPGAQRPATHLVPWRAPGFETPTLPFTEPDGAKMFFSDLIGLIAFAVAAVWAMVRSFSRPVAAAGTFLVVLCALGIFALGRLDIPPKAVEAHRFVTAPMLAGPLVVLCWLFARDGPGRLPFVQSASVVALALPALSTFAWLRSPGHTNFMTNKSFFTNEDFYQTDCRKELGAHLGERPRVTYLATNVFFVYTGCHPVFTAGLQGGHRIKTSRPLQGWDAFKDINDSMLKPGEPLDVICPKAPIVDTICRRAQLHECETLGTTRLGTEIVRCELDAEARASLMEIRFGR